MEWRDWIGKRVFISLVSGKIYNCVVLSVDDISARPPVSWISIKDKFDKNVTILSSEIKLIQEER